MELQNDPPMDQTWYQRTQILYGAERMQRLAAAHVLVVGLGGVGAYAAEMLCRAGVGRLTLVDADAVSLTNINRQLPALHSTIGQSKVQLLRQRFLDINPDVRITAIAEFMDEAAVPGLLDAAPYDFVADAIDTVRPKCALIEGCMDRRIPVISAMGAGAKTDIRRIRQTDISKTTQCGLAKAVRTAMRRDGYARRALPVIFSDEPVRREAILTVEGERNKKSTAGTTAYITATFGNWLAWYILEHL